MRASASVNRIVRPAVTVPSATAAANPDRVNADGRGRAITASRSPAQSSRSAAVPVDPIRSKRPTETASPIWTHSIEPVAMRAPVRGEDGRTSGEVGAATTTSEGETIVRVHVRIMDTTSADHGR